MQKPAYIFYQRVKGISFRFKMKRIYSKNDDVCIKIKTIPSNLSSLYFKKNIYNL